MADLDKIAALLLEAHKGMLSIPGDPASKLNKAQRAAYHAVHVLIHEAMKATSEAARSAVPAQASAPAAVTDLHAAIMNLPCRGFDHAYKEGHRDARHAAAELAAAAQVPAQGEIVAKAKRYDWLLENPDQVTYGAFFDRTRLGPNATVSEAIDAAMSRQGAEGGR